MGFHIPDSPPRRTTTTSASSQTAMMSTASQANPQADANAVQFSERFSSRRIVRRRNALIPTLSIDVVGSPRSPFVCLSRDHRFALSQQHEQARQPSSDASSSIDSDNSHLISQNSSSRARETKRAPGIRRRSEQRDTDLDASFATRASVNVHETP